MAQGEWAQEGAKGPADRTPGGVPGFAGGPCMTQATIPTVPANSSTQPPTIAIASPAPEPLERNLGAAAAALPEAASRAGKNPALGALGTAKVGIA